MKYIIEGGKKLNGQITVSGNKNSVFPCIAAALLTDQEVVLENIPKISDTDVLVEILENIGVNVQRSNTTITIKATKLSHVLPKELMIKLRGSIVLVGAILARVGKVEFFHPGGDVIGKRGIESHLEGFVSLGADYEQDDLSYKVMFKNKLTTPKLDIFLPERSVTATENLILVSSLGKRTVKLRNCASEPHVVDLCNMLSQMGVVIAGIGTDTLIIKGVTKPKGTKFRIRADYTEIGTYAVAAAITDGQITMNGLDNTDLDPIISVLRRFGVSVVFNKDTVTFSATNLKGIPFLITNVWPGFPTDLMSVFIVLATQSLGVTLCHDWMFESRMFFVDKLMSMGANITIADPHRVFVYGSTPLRGRELETPDIRAGMALVLAALVAKGKSIVNRAELIERGYTDPVEKLSSLGANIQRET
ncbi:MAG: UDP-N-acetylglucosamine 1-carboxyvinyltransferase [Candidatus Daviesbacteria bacterium]|nr:UDP-N-acetylglucosamine 1-carboxyvinyltransferase [Candidatus Daviesbacteria bacterium]